MAVLGLATGTARATGILTSDPLPFPKSVPGYCDEFTAAAVAGDAGALDDVAARAGFVLSAPPALIGARDFVGVSCLEEKAGDGTGKIIAVVLALGARTTPGVDGLLVLLPSDQSNRTRADWTQWVHDTHGQQTPLLDVLPAGDGDLVAFFDSRGGRSLRGELRPMLNTPDRIILTSEVARSISRSVGSSTTKGR